MFKICLIAGARPNFMKIAPIVDAINAHNGDHKSAIEYILVHTGQHYDESMSKLFFHNLGSFMLKQVYLLLKKFTTWGQLLELRNLKPHGISLSSGWLKWRQHG